MDHLHVLETDKAQKLFLAVPRAILSTFNNLMRKLTPINNNHNYNENKNSSKILCINNNKKKEKMFLPSLYLRHFTRLLVSLPSLRTRPSIFRAPGASLAPTISRPQSSPPSTNIPPSHSPSAYPPLKCYGGVADVREEGGGPATNKRPRRPLLPELQSIVTIKDTTHIRMHAFKYSIITNVFSFNNAKIPTQSHLQSRRTLGIRNKRDDVTRQSKGIVFAFNGKCGDII
ncbi:hypothetical protein SK128_006758 [Halocaridina rubra]|uniref:Uncharacterized protein n=1 Tax=Halocaridina rubra TaxID=373956 RepID=A0AAN9A9T0_HALRR